MWMYQVGQNEKKNWNSRIFVKENEVLAFDSQHKIWKFRYSFQNGWRKCRGFRPQCLLWASPMKAAGEWTWPLTSISALIKTTRTFTTALSSGLYDFVPSYVGSEKSNYKLSTYLKEEHTYEADGQSVWERTPCTIGKSRCPPGNQTLADQTVVNIHIISERTS